MPDLRKDPMTGIWVTLAPERKLRPRLNQPEPQKSSLPLEECPFCPGNEEMTTAEIYALRPNRSGWELRVVANKFPALRVEGELKRQGEGLYDRMTGIGAHEVVIECRDHDLDMAGFAVDHLKEVLLTYKRRILDLKRDIRFRYIQVFKNHGALAGATIPHPHSQIVAMPVIPARMLEKVNRTNDYFEKKERCLCCDILDHEFQANARLLTANEHFALLAPYAPRLPFELVLYPRAHQAHFAELDDSLFYALAVLLKEALGKINKALEAPAYNLVLQTAPLDRDCGAFFHWHLEIIPVISGTGGFELGTFSYLNPIPPEESIKILKNF